MIVQVCWLCKSLGEMLQVFVHSVYLHQGFIPPQTEINMVTDWGKAVCCFHVGWC